MEGCAATSARVPDGCGSASASAPDRLVDPARAATYSCAPWPNVADQILTFLLGSYKHGYESSGLPNAPSVSRRGPIFAVGWPAITE